MADLLDIIKGNLSGSQISKKVSSAKRWFDNIVKRRSSAWLRVTPNDIVQRGDKVNDIEIGSLYFYIYDPKHKKTLPYYDKFPIVFPIDKAPGGFYGLNLHYLGPRQRAILMTKLMDIRNNTKMDGTTKLRISYNLLKGFSRFREAEPCLKRYLFKHVKTKYVKIEADEWENAIFLPVERFEKADNEKVWRDSKRRIR